MNKQLFRQSLPFVVDLYQVVDLRDGGRDEEREDECCDVPCLMRISKFSDEGEVRVVFPSKED